MFSFVQASFSYNMYMRACGNVQFSRRACASVAEGFATLGHLAIIQEFGKLNLLLVWPA